MAELLSSLHRYHVSKETGFLPSVPPLERLPNPYYEPWEKIATSLPRYIHDRTLKARIHSMPVLSTSFLHTDREWQRAYVILGYICNGYLFGGGTAENHLPRTVSQPIKEVSSYLGLPPAPTYAGQVLWNFRQHSDHSQLPHPDNVETLISFTGSPEESGFFGVLVAIEARAGPLITALLQGIDASREHRFEQLIQCLQTVEQVLKEITSLLPLMYKRCSREFFYNTLRLFLRGMGDMSSPGTVNGVFFEEEQGGSWNKFFGPSNAQSSVFTFIDAALGISHEEGHKEKSTTGKSTYLKEMKSYMPEGHRRFLNEVEKLANIRETVHSHRQNGQLLSAYEECLAALVKFREAHIQMVARYVVIMAKRPLSEKSEEQINSGTRNKAAVGGTGGTDAMSFLKSVRDSVLQSKSPNP